MRKTRAVSNWSFYARPESEPEAEAGAAAKENVPPAREFRARTDRNDEMERRVRMRQQLSDFKAEFFKALAHPLRISILDALREGELTVNEISQRFAVEPANASQQLAVLRKRNIVMTRKDGANVYYSVSDKSIFKLLDAAKEIFSHHLIDVRSMLEEIHAPTPGVGVREAGRKGVVGSRP
jgi:ArsR family transcriptional regulator